MTNASWLKLAGLLGAALAVWFMGISPATATPTYDGNGIAAPSYPTPYIGARADWSSDLGADYEFHMKGDNYDASVPVVGAGNGSYTSNKSAINTYESGFDLHYALDARGGGAGNTFSEGWLSIPDTGTVDPNQVFQFRLRNVLGDNSPGLGISTEAHILTNFYFGNVTPADTLYYAMDWSGSLITTGQTDATVMINGISSPYDIQPRRPVVGQFASNNHDIYSVPVDAGEHYFSGSDHGTLGSNSLFGIDFMTYLDDVAGIAGAGTQDVTVRVAFSTSAITGVPVPGVPEPDSYAMLLAGLGLLGLIARRGKQQEATA